MKTVNHHLTTIVTVGDSSRNHQRMLNLVCRDFLLKNRNFGLRMPCTKQLSVTKEKTVILWSRALIKNHVDQVTKATSRVPEALL